MNTPDDFLDKRVRLNYESMSLSESELAQLRDSIDAEEPGTAATTRAVGRRRLLMIGIAAVALALIGVGLGLHALWPRRLAPSWNGEAVALEICQHHLQNLDPEIRSDSIAGLASQMMSRLGFAPVDPLILQAEGLTVEGGRYCSIATFAAAQIRLRDPSGRPCTLYEFRAASAGPEPSPEEHSIGGVRVRLWRDGDLVFGLAQPR